MVIPQLIRRALDARVHTDYADIWKFRIFPYRAYLFWAHPHWIDFDRTWLLLRNEHFDITRKRLASEASSSHSFQMEPIYDSVRALATAVQGNEHNDSVLFSAYHCFQDLSQSLLSEQGEYPSDHLQACYRDLVPTWNSPIANIATLVVDPQFDLLHDIHTVLFLRLPGLFYKAINPSHIMGKHMLELHTRLLGHLYAKEPRKLTSSRVSGPTGFFHWYTINMASLHQFPEMQDAFFHQYFMIFRSFIQTASTITHAERTVSTFHTHSDLDDFLSLAAYLTWRTVEKATERNNEDDSSLSTLLLSLDDMRSTLNLTSVDESSGQHDFLFCCAALYLRRLWQEKPHPGIRRPESRQWHRVIRALCITLDTFQRETLLPYEKRLDTVRFLLLYGSFLPSRALPRIYFELGLRNFHTYGTVMTQATPTRTSSLSNQSLSSNIFNLGTGVSRLSIATEGDRSQSKPGQVDNLGKILHYNSDISKLV